MVRCLASVLISGAILSAATSHTCVGSVAVTSFRLSAQPATRGPGPVPVRHMNALPSGSRVSYQPLDLPADLKKDAKLTLVMVPKASDGQVTVLEPRLAANSTEWTTPFAANVMVLVFAPQGLDEKRLTNLVTKDANLVAALADYADQTADLEAGLEAASELEQDADDDSARPARPATPGEQALFALVRALNPAVSSFDPLGTGRRAGSATLMGKSAEAFFDNAGGFVPGGGILPSVKGWLMPDTEFRSVYAMPGVSDGMTLCSQLEQKSRNKMAYLWAYRLSNAPPPVATIASDTHVPIGMRASAPLKLNTQADWRLLDRVYDWALIPESGSSTPLHVNARPVYDARALQLDLRKFVGAPGVYRVQGSWDWDVYRPVGTVNLHKLDDLKSAQVVPASQDRLITGAGPIPVELSGPDFLFVDRAWLHRPAGTREIPVDLPSDRGSAANKLSVEVDTDGLRPGPYVLALSRIDGATADVPLQVLPPNPRIDSASLRVNLGEREQTATLTGSGLDRIEKIDADRADVALPPAGEGDGSRRAIAVRLHADAKVGDRLALSAKVTGLNGPLRLPGVLQVVAPRPKIREAKATLARDLPIAPRDGEVPAGSWVNYAIKSDATGSPSVSVQCAEPARTIQVEKLRAGEKHANAQLTQGDDGTLFLSFDPGAVGQPGCSLTAIVETDALGASDPFPLGKVVRLPRIESLGLTDEKSVDGYYGVLTGYDLDTITKTGWSAAAGVSVAEIPQTMAGQGARQNLRVVLPWPSPSPKAPLFIWLRGEAEGRPTKVSP